MEECEISFDYCVKKYLFWCDQLRNESPVTVTDKKYRLNQFKKITNIEHMSELTNQLVDGYIVNMKKITYRGAPIKAGTINKRLNLIICFVKWCRSMLDLKVPIKLEMVFYLKKEVTTRKKYYNRTDVAIALSHADER